MRIVKDRTDAFRVVWTGWGDDPPRFVRVLLGNDHEANRQPEYQHIGLAVDGRAAAGARRRPIYGWYS